MKSLTPRHTCLPPATCCPRPTLREESRGFREEGAGGPGAGSDRTVPSGHFLRSLRTSATANRPRLPPSLHPSRPLAARPGWVRGAAPPPRGPGRRDGAGRPAAGGASRGRAPQLAGDAAAGPPAAPPGKLSAGTLRTHPRARLTWCWQRGGAGSSRRAPGGF